jgi:hypothetical protein
MSQPGDILTAEEGRHRVYSRLEAMLGHEEATMLMEHLPPVGWADVATKRDLDHATADARHDIDQLRSEMRQLGSELRTEMAIGQRQIGTTWVFAMLTANVTLAGLGFAAARLT